MTNQVDVEALKVLAEAATPGPWAAFIVGETLAVSIGPKPSGLRPNIVDWMGFDGCELSLQERKKNARYIAAANPQAILALIAAIESLRAQLEQRRDALAEIKALEAELERLKQQIGGFPNVDALRMAMLDTADENDKLRAELEQGRTAEAVPAEFVREMLSDWPSIGHAYPRTATHCIQHIANSAIAWDRQRTTAPAIKPEPVSKSLYDEVGAETLCSRETFDAVNARITQPVSKGDDARLNPVTETIHAHLVRLGWTPPSQPDCKECNDAGCMYCAEFAKCDEGVA